MASPHLLSLQRLFSTSLSSVQVVHHPSSLERTASTQVENSFLCSFPHSFAFRHAPLTLFPKPFWFFDFRSFQSNSVQSFSICDTQSRYTAADLHHHSKQNTHL
ncbi:hypothetical protein BR93DRAFT_472373 [Coniochaeta sp. PMI_546]|nr:hypothetical protein BR93DRAFT_472373 [Coniochaeta sp. PMI_546]